MPFTSLTTGVVCAKGFEIGVIPYPEQRPVMRFSGVGTFDMTKLDYEMSEIDAGQCACAPSLIPLPLACTPTICEQRAGACALLTPSTLASALDNSSPTAP